MTRTKKRGPLPYEPSLVIPKTAKAVCSIGWLEELEAALTHVEKAYKARVPDESVPDHDALRGALADLREIVRAERRHSSNDDSPTGKP